MIAKKAPMGLALLGLLACASFAYAGGAEESGKAKASAPAKRVETLTLPIVKEPLTVKYWVLTIPRVTAYTQDYNGLLVYQEMEKRTGIKIDFIHPPTGQEKDQFNLMVASRNLPDMISYNWIKDFPGGPTKAIEEGIIIPLNDIIENYMPNLRKLIAENPERAREMRNDAGQYYAFPLLVWDDLKGDLKGASGTSLGLQVRQDYLDKLGLPLPETIDDWYRTLTAFKTQLKVESPLNIFYTFLQRSHAFAGAYGASFDFHRSGGKVKFGPMEPGYREMLTTLRKWYAEGLINPDFSAQDRNMHDAYNTSGKAGAWVHYLTSGMQRYIDTVKDPSFKPVATKYPVVKKGETALIGYDESATGAILDNAIAFTPANKRIAETAQWVDYFYSQEGTLLQAWGVEGVSFNLDAAGVPKLIGDYISKIPYNSGLQISGLRDLRVTAAIPEPRRSGFIRYHQTNAVNSLLPVLTPTIEEASVELAVMNDVRTYVDEMFIKFIIGVEPLSNWDKYVNQIRKIGIDKVLAAKQAQLDRYSKR